MKIKKLCRFTIALAIVAVMVFSLAACDKSPSGGVTSITLDQANLTLAVGGEAQLNALIMPASAENTAKSWSSSNAEVASVSNAGLVKGLKAGTAKIKVSAGGKSATCDVTVTDNGGAALNPTGITVSPSRVTLSLTGTNTAQLTANLTPANVQNNTVNWTSNNTAVATVSAAGLVTAVANGTTTIVARTSNGYTASCFVTVGDGVAQKSELYVRKVDSLSTRGQDFIMAMDASEVISLENAGVKYKDFDGQEKDVFEILKNNGITDIRVRIWNDPTDGNGNSYGGGNCDVANAKAIAQRCAQYGLGMIVNFHYSDFWADPGKQTLPKAWKGKTTGQIADAIYDFTLESLNDIKTTGVKISMVQIGNETTGGMAGSIDTQNGWSTVGTTVCNYINRGAQAVRAATGAVVNGGAKVAVHFTNAGGGGYMSFADMLNANHVDYDVFGSSWYPYYASHGTLSNLTEQFRQIHTKYNKEVMVLETAYAFTYDDFDGCGNTGFETTTQPITVQGMSNAVREVIQAISDLGDWGLGIAYWGGIWIAASTSTDGATNRAICAEYGCGWATHFAYSYDDSARSDGGTMVDNNAFFLSDGTPIEALKVFSLAKEGQAVPLTADYLEEQEIYYTVNEGPIELPATAHVVLNDGSVQDTTAMWDVDAADLAEYISTVGKYTVKGTTRYGGECVCNVWVLNVNLLKGSSFEANEGFKGYGDATTKFVQTGAALNDWKLTYKKATDELQLFVSTNEGNAVMGTQSFHFWDRGTVEFELYQEISLSDLSEFGFGKYGCSFDIQGDSGTKLDIYAFIRITRGSGEPETIKGNKASLLGWQDWDRTAITGCEIDDTVTKIEVGIHVYAEVESGTDGPWGNIDNAQFYFEGASESAAAIASVDDQVVETAFVDSEKRR